MVYHCINCQETWNDDTPDDPDGYMSSGLCFPCLMIKLIPMWRKNQRTNGFPDCFGKSMGNCVKTHCSYHEVCVRWCGPWEVAEIEAMVIAKARQ